MEEENDDVENDMDTTTLIPPSGTDRSKQNWKVRLKRITLTTRVIFVVAVCIFTVACLIYFLHGESQKVFRLASYYGDHMVLQMEPHHSIIWGYGEQNSDIELNLNGT
ncbi:uncharacterized protein LOC144344665, partial [Saccoglossus kowalevskii]